MSERYGNNYIILNNIDAKPAPFAVFGMLFANEVVGKVKCVGPRRRCHES
jgi:hypothetical protein